MRYRTGRPRGLAFTALQTSELQRFLEQMTYWVDQDPVKQRAAAEAAFDGKFKQYEEEKTKRHISNHLGVGIKPLTAQQIESLSALRGETNADFEAEYRLKALKELTPQFIPQHPAGFKGLDMDYKAPAVAEIKQRKGKPSVVACAVQNPTRSDFTPQPVSILRHRQQNQDRLRRAVNKVVYRNRAEKSLRKLQETLGLREHSGQVAHRELTQQIIAGSVDREMLARVGVDKAPHLESEVPCLGGVESGKWELFEGGKKEAGYVFASYFVTGCSPGPELKWASWDEHMERLLELE